jgi:hypothetical protein
MVTFGMIQTDRSYQTLLSSHRIHCQDFLYQLKKTVPEQLHRKTGTSMQYFQDYEPQIVVMPRVAFSFSITDQAQFFAHYDVLTQRPSSNLRNDPSEYLQFLNVTLMEL